jgi:tellurite resistance protein TehA-like permease
MQIKARGWRTAVVDRFCEGVSGAEPIQAQMGLLQTGADDTRRADVSPVKRRGWPAGGEDGREGLGRVPRRSVFASLVADLPGGSFAFVMATGIVSIATMRLGRGGIAGALFAVNLVAFALLWVLMLVRLVRHPAAVLGELRNHRTGAGFLTSVAATSILGNQFVLLASNREVAAALWLCSLALWVGLTYAFFVSMTIRPVKPPLAGGLDGAWLLTVVATEALAILATHVASVFSRPDIVVFVGLCLFLLGGGSYLILISLIVHRWLFEPMQPEQLTLPYWINMGAAAIAALAGARLVSIAGSDPLIAEIAQPIFAAVVLFWSIATWWIPLLVTLLVWRHIVHGIRPSFRMEYWSMVFPLGMYTAASWALSRQNGAEFLAVIPRVTLWIALAAWLLGFIGMIRHLWRLLHHAQTGFRAC